MKRRSAFWSAVAGLIGIGSLVCGAAYSQSPSARSDLISREIGIYSADMLLMTLSDNTLQTSLIDRNEQRTLFFRWDGVLYKREGDAVELGRWELRNQTVCFVMHSILRADCRIIGEIDGVVMFCNTGAMPLCVERIDDVTAGDAVFFDRTRNFSWIQK